VGWVIGMTHDAERVPERVPATRADLVFLRLRSEWEPEIAMECEFAGHLDEHLLGRATELLLEVEPMLAYELIADSAVPHWRRTTTSAREIVTVARSREEYERAYGSTLDACRGAQVAVILLPKDDGDRLLVKITHVIGDGVSLRIVSSRLSELYSALEADPDHRPEPGSIPPRDFGAALAQFPRLTRTRAMLDFLWFMAPRTFPRESYRLPLPDSSSRLSVPVVRTSSTSINVLARYAKQRGATANDVLLAAVYRALAATGWDGKTALRIAIAVNMRASGLPPEYASALANLSAWEYPYLMRDLGDTFDETLARVSALTRRRKRRHPGLAFALIVWFVTRNLARNRDEPAARPAPAAAEPRHTLSLSSVGKLGRSRLTFGKDAPTSAHVFGSLFRASHPGLVLSNYGGRLTVVWLTSERNATAAGAFIDAVLDQLPSIADDARAPTAAVVEPVDPRGEPTGESR